MPVVIHLDAKTGEIIDAAPEEGAKPESVTQCVAEQQAKAGEPVKDGIATLHTCAVRREDEGKLPEELKPAKPEPNREWHDEPGQRLDRKDSVTI